MSYHEIINAKERIIKAVIKVGAREGVNNVTGRKVSRHVKLSTYKIFDTFTTKQGYLDESATYIITNYSNKVKKYVVEYNNNEHDIFIALLKDLIQDKNSTLYLISYFHEFGTNGLSTVAPSDFFDIPKLLLGEKENWSDDIYEFAGRFLGHSLLNYAEHFIHDVYVSSDLTYELAYMSVYNGLNSIQ